MRYVFILTLSLISFGLTVVSCQTVERPVHTVEIKEQDYEIRKYPDLQLVSTSTLNGRNQSFRKLFQYIDKGNKAGEKIAMTTPVIMATEEVSKSWKNSMNFIVPSNIAKQGAPQPLTSEVELNSLEGGKFAVTSFKQSHNEEAKKEAVNKLNTWLEKKGINITGEPIFAYYNPPWTLQALRTNEVWIPVK